MIRPMSELAKKSGTSRRRGRKKSSDLAAGEYTVDQLARTSDTTVRNIRAYQDRGILPAPEKRGRLGVYNDNHLARLDLINNLLDRGYSIENIRELLNAWLDGRELSDILGLERALTLAFNAEQPQEYTISQLLKMFGLKKMSKDLLDQATKMNLLVRKGTKFIAPSPSLIESGQKMVALGMPFDEILEVLRLLRGNVQRAADGLVGIAFARFDEFGDDLPPQEKIQELSELIWELRPLAQQAILDEATRALNESLRKFLGDRMSSVLEHMHDDQSDDLDGIQRFE